MTKAQMQARLDTALDLLTEAADHSRLPKGLRQRFAAFVEETKAMPDNGGSGERLWRLAERARRVDAVLDRLARRIVAGLVLASSILATAYLYPIDWRAAAVPAAIGVASSVLLYRSFRASRGFRAQPQFTRQAMRELRESEEE